MTHQETFIQIYQEHIHRRGADQLLAWLQSDASDFFTAPSSTRYHGSYEGGLVEHSLIVWSIIWHGHVQKNCMAWIIRMKPLHWWH